MAFVIVTHLSPNRHSLLDEVIARYTASPVKIAEDGAEVRADTVYIMPEGKILTIADGKLRLRDDDPIQRERKPIDVFFASLAEDQGENAVGIVLSGGGGDGTLGVKAIKERGGITLAQAGNGTGPRNPEMPHSAVASGLIDFAEPVQSMPERLLKLRDGRGALGALVVDEQDLHHAHEARQAQEKIARLLLNRTGHDFAGYKSKTFLRRVARRMKVVQLFTFDAYIQHLKDDPSEIVSLFRDLLINVTNFFRDSAAFAALETQVIPRLFAGRGADDTIRLWVPGCATGEEVFSLGILMREHMDGLEVVPKVQIFATDIDDEALSTARAGRYPDALLSGLGSERLKRFFRRDGGSLVISKEVREMCIFSPHSVIADPPFSRMDLVSCRNLLIYLGGDLQDRVIPTFHYALKPGGYLFLGTSEGVSRHSDLFAPVDKQNRLFQSRDHGGPRRLPMAYEPASSRTRQDHAEKGREAYGVHLRQRIELQVLERHTPGHVVVTHDGETLYFSSNTERYLQIPQGAPNRNIFDLARREFRADLRAMLRQTTESREPAIRQVLMVDRGGEDSVMVELSTELLEDAGTQEDLFLVLFKPLGQWRPKAATGTAEAIAHEAEASLERELRDMRERLQSTVEEYETALEELKSSNEELVSVNEEAQSTNEELEASREEMQSLNEELSTINNELATSVEQLDRANTDLKNLYAATQIATVFLDRNLVIRNFTPVAGAFFNIRESDIGRPMTDLAGALQYPELEDEVRAVLRSGDAIERRLPPDRTKRHFLVRLVPYRNQDEHVGGIVVTVVDISSLAEAEQQQKVLISELNHRVKNMLAVVVSIANFTKKTSSNMDEFVDRLIGRLNGMARAYSLLSGSEWSGVELRDLLHAEVEVFGADRVTAEGPALHLTPEHALSLGMIVHEMATNAAKYGALSEIAGRVNVAWEVKDGQAHLTWVEQGGPLVNAPAEKGFGLVLIEGQVRSQMEGEIETDFRPDGLVLKLSFPLKD
ncbi:Blue-light-activated histidine kinase 1 [Palleronia abyssalis]|uniref:Blue-light-activated histidine kinase 1 n=2 Tax=Palleronia abyssalis TaxID=1501240 RepID=A0A2R8BV88_9RHOB|nr:Blue-light-activated histidine kinase 1 [Palleronia abyssalis]